MAATLAATFARRSTRQLYEGQGRIGKKIFFICMYAICNTEFRIPVHVIKLSLGTFVYYG